MDTKQLLVGKKVRGGNESGKKVDANFGQPDATVETTRMVDQYATLCVPLNRWSFYT